MFSLGEEKFSFVLIIHFFVCSTEYGMDGTFDGNNNLSNEPNVLLAVSDSTHDGGCDLLTSTLPAEHMIEVYNEYMYGEETVE